MGYMQINKVVSLRSKEDIREFMRSVEKGNNILLWCDGLEKEPEKNARNEKTSHLTALTQMMKILPESVARKRIGMTKSSAVLKS